MIRVGIVDCDTSHVVAFTQRLNHVGIGEEQWVDGGKVVMAYPGQSLHSPERVPEYTAKLRDEYGVQIVNSLEEMIGKIDAVCVEANDGQVHLEHVRPFLEAGIPAFVDKPFACSVSDAKEMARLAKTKGVPVFSASSLRYAPEVVSLLARREELGAVMGVDACSPASLHPRNPGLFNYGIHGVEILYTLMGPGCCEVACFSTEGTDMVMGRWSDGRLATLRGTRAGAHHYGFTAFCEKGVVQSPAGTDLIYRDLLNEIVGMFQTGKPPIDIRETVEIVAFIETARLSAERGGKPLAMPTVG